MKGRNTDDGLTEQSGTDRPRTEKQGPREQTRIALAVCLTLILTLTFCAGLYFAVLNPRGTGTGHAGAALPTAGAQTIEAGGLRIGVVEGDADSAKNLQKLGDVLDDISANYYQKLTPGTLLEAMSKGLPAMVGSPYTYYLSAENMKMLEEMASGHYSGIGARIATDAANVYSIVDVTAGGPAEKAGLQPGDRIIRIDGREISQFKNSMELAAAVKGVAGTEVRVGIYRPSAAKEEDYTLTRRDIESVEVREKMLDSHTGYLQIVEFSRNLPEQFEKSLRSLINQGAKNIVFDLRNNPGGDANAVRKVLDMLLPEGPIATIRGRSDGKPYEEQWKTTAKKLAPDSMRYAILANQNSASAAELFSGCLRDRGKAILIGEKTFGKGSGTVTFNLPDGSGVNVTVFRYFLPAGDCIEEKGLQPDKPVSLPDAVKNKDITQLTPEQDTQLATAKRYLDGLQ